MTRVAPRLARGGRGLARRLRVPSAAFAPTRDEPPRLGGASFGQQRRQVLGRVDVEPEPRQREHARRETALARRRQVAREGRLAERQRHRVGRRQRDAVGAKPGA